MLELRPIRKSDPQLQKWMAVHYSAPKGFVGRQLIYTVYYNSVCYGAIAAGSATLHLPGRLNFYGILPPLNNLVNNTFFQYEKMYGVYPVRNFAQNVVRAWRQRVLKDWPSKYGDKVLGFETLVELPRTGELYRRDGWIEVGITKGFTCKRTAGNGTDSWSGKRVWNTTELRPKRVFCRNP